MQKITQNLHLISANKNTLPFSTRKLLYNSLIRPYLEYGAEVWGNKHIKTINKLQKKCIRHVIKTNNYISHTNNYFRLLQTPKFNDIVKLNTCRLAYKIIHYEEPPGLCNTIELKLQNSKRRQYDIIPTQKPNQKLEHHVMFKIANTWNSLPEKAKEPCTPYTFKERAKKALIQKYDDIPDCSIRNCPSCVTGRPFQSLTT